MDFNGNNFQNSDCFDVPTAKFEFKPLGIYSTEQKSKLISMFWEPADEPDAEPFQKTPRPLQVLQDQRCLQQAWQILQLVLLRVGHLLLMMWQLLLVIEPASW